MGECFLKFKSPGKLGAANLGSSILEESQLSQPFCSQKPIFMSWASSLIRRQAVLFWRRILSTLPGFSQNQPIRVHPRLLPPHHLTREVALLIRRNTRIRLTLADPTPLAVMLQVTRLGIVSCLREQFQSRYLNRISLLLLFMTRHGITAPA